MLVYISGAITNDKHYRKKFAKAEKNLKKQGYDVINPAKIGDVLPELTYKGYLEVDLALVKQADILYMLQGWEDSQGANIEHSAGVIADKIIVYEID